MNERDDGGPAFPRPISSTPDRQGVELEISGEQDGMSLRDYFAGQALAGIMATAADMTPGQAIGIIARDCYQLADAMIAERAKAEGR